MRKIKLFIACSLDGYIARKNGEVDWLFTDSDYGYKKFFHSIDTMLMGRKTYEKALELGDSPDKGKKWYVFTRNRGARVENGVEFVPYSTSIVNKLRTDSGKDIWLVGGGEIVSLFLSDNLLDELFVYIHPVILGSGIRLFKETGQESKLKLVSTRHYKSGLVMIHYEK